MKIRLQINFHTVWGQSLYITGSLFELGSWDTASAKAMQHIGEGNWIFEMDLPDKPVSFEYRYFLRSNNQFIFEEWQRNHKQIITDTKPDYVLIDYWQNQPQNTAFYSSAFYKSWFAHPCDKFERIVKSQKKLCIKVLASEIERNQSIAVIGNQPELGNWNINKALIMACDHFPEWSIELDASALSYPIEYKFCIVENESKSLIEWEKGDNRVLAIPPINENETGIVSGLQFRKDFIEWKCAGTVIPVFSLRSETSFGIGDFGDMKKCIDWLKFTSQKILQILPVNDTTQTHTWTDSYPYNAISIYALHPIYLNLNAMGELNATDRKMFYENMQASLNASEEVDYEQVDKYKRMFFSELFIQDGNKTLQSPEFLSFFDKNKEWLIPYAAYSYLRDKYRTGDFRSWREYSRYDREAIEKFCQPDKPHYSEIALYYYLQFHLHKQLSEVREYAHSKGIVLKGDVPIGISKTSIEAWTEPEYFNSQYQTGAPPDDFSLTGQNWGFPTYRWEKMEADHYCWWKKRFRKMEDYFDAFRIDHILGFFRIWEIPEDSVQGLLGWFSPALPFSEEEIKNSGFDFVLEKYTNAHINEQFLPELFGEYTEEVTQIYLNRTSSRHFALKEPFDTQIKIQTHFSGKDDNKSRIIQEGLYAICNEVLFIRDKRRSNYFHPRISASHSYIYKELNPADQYAFNYLYRDYFYQRHNEFWKEEGYKKLFPLVSSTDMLVCGEDLGMIPQCVPEVMQKLQILSLEIEQMPKEINREFTDLNHLPYLSVCTTSTHDMPTLRLEWKENREKTQRYYNEVLKREGNAPKECTPDICEQIILNHLYARSMLTIIPLQDWFSLDGDVRKKNDADERINVPANSTHYWKYRMHLNLEILLKADKLNEKIIRLIQQTQR
ncbi:MAG: 4-alpha-glucanotransferase [Candidatus Azobacteroides sp.]|nr:4-alpha-glucanotransferase [Candidatus Azobacteroides sp.]